VTTSTQALLLLQSSVHRAGNKGNEEDMLLSGVPLALDWQLTEALQEYF